MTKNWLLCLALCSTAACHAESATQPALSFALDDRRYVPIRLVVTPSRREQQRLLSTDPFELQLVITENTAGRVRGVVSSRSMPGLPMQAITGTIAGGRLQFSSDRIAMGPGESVTLRHLDVLGSTGRGSASGDLSAVGGDVVDHAEFAATVSASVDEDAGVMSFLVAQGRTTRELLTSDRIEALLSEPVAAPALASVTVKAGTTRVPGVFQPVDPVLGLATRATFVPDGFPPSGAALSLDPGGLTDPAGHPFTWDGATLTTAADVGPLTANASFEDGLRGWQTIGDASAVGAFEGLLPAAGAAQAVITEDSGLAGYLDVPPHARELTLSFAVLSQMGEFDANHSVVIALVAHDGTRTVIVDGLDERARGERGTFGEYRHRIPPRVARVDLTPYRGQRVTLTADVRSSGYMGLQHFALVIDDVQVR